MLYTVRFKTKDSRDHAIDVLDRHGVESRIAFPPIHLQPQYIKKYGSTKLPVTDRISTLVLSLPIFPRMTRDMQDKVVAALKDSFRTTQ
jgi:dTDP-4-amino-4,6-dideoxygalactose transaminase